MLCKKLLQIIAIYSSSNQANASISGTVISYSFIPCHLYAPSVQTQAVEHLNSKCACSNCCWTRSVRNGFLLTCVTSTLSSIAEVLVMGRVLTRAMLTWVELVFLLTRRWARFEGPNLAKHESRSFGTAGKRPTEIKDQELWSCQKWNISCFFACWCGTSSWSSHCSMDHLGSLAEWQAQHHWNKQGDLLIYRVY